MRDLHHANSPWKQVDLPHDWAVEQTFGDGRTLTRKPIGDPAQQRCALSSAEASKSRERGFREAGGPVNVLARGRVENRLQLLCTGWVYCAK
jgi:hypothetical protein